MIGMEQSSMAEARFYVLMALSNGEKSKVEVLDYICNHTRRRVSVWPGMLCTILDQLRESGMVTSGARNSCGAVYALTERGRFAYGEALERLFACASDAMRAAAPTNVAAQRAVV